MMRVMRVRCVRMMRVMRVRCVRMMRVMRVMRVMSMTEKEMATAGHEGR
jgi:hypothetical protein